jgi:predicted nucleic acid-binding protein
MAVYLDSSALVKLVVAERESEALRRFIRRSPDRISSALARVEVLWAVRMQDAPITERARRVLARIRLLRLDDALLDAAAALDPTVLRSLDAIHLASAQAVGSDLDCVITYDRRMSDAAGELGLHVRSPGTPGDRPKRLGARRATR